ncbi:hypothetical protein [Nocardioides litoris]|uniref:hypothetical protein n=1 Tax=Nocardioides litoris TaxID=1926648 RepID=UPI0011225332|nr:hypothetical protein [Nocardioides litoris]
MAPLVTHEDQHESGTTRGRDRHHRSRLRAAALAGTAATVLVAGAAWATTAGPADGSGSGSGGTTTAEALRSDQEARAGGQQVLGGERDPGVPSVQRLRHDDVDFTVTVAPARPGPNLVRIDVSAVGDAHGEHGEHSEHSTESFQVGTPGSAALTTATPRPGADGVWAVVDLPEGSGTVLVSHGPDHRVPFAVETGFADDARAAGGPAPQDWQGPDGPECLTAATTAVLAGGEVPTACPSARLADHDADALRETVAWLAGRGVEELTLQGDGSPRSRAATDLVRGEADRLGVRLAPADAPASSTQGVRNALLVVGGWSEAADDLAAVSRLPLRQQPIRSDGTWLAPWLLTPGVVDSTSGAVLPLDFDIRDGAAQEYSQTLATFFPGQAPTASGYQAWRTARGGEPSPHTLYAASRAAYMPDTPGHAAHSTQVSWFPGGTVTPVGPLGTDSTRSLPQRTPAQ